MKIVNIAIECLEREINKINEQIDFLKLYKKNKLRTIKTAVILNSLNVKKLKAGIKVLKEVEKNV